MAKKLSTEDSASDKSSADKRIKNKQDKEEKALKALLIKYYSHHLTIFQNKILLNQVKIKISEDDIENVEIQAYQTYKNALSQIAKKGLVHLITTCALVNSAEPDHKAVTLLNCCHKFKIQV